MSTEKLFINIIFWPARSIVLVLFATFPRAVSPYMSTAMLGGLAGLSEYKGVVLMRFIALNIY